MSNAIDYAKFYSRSRNAVICVCDEAGNVIGTREQSAPEALQRCGVDSVRFQFEDAMNISDRLAGTRSRESFE